MTTDPSRILWAGLAVLLWLGTVAAVTMGHRRARARAAARSTAFATGTDAVLVAFASQTGQAERMAWMTAETLSRAGTAARVGSLGSLTPAELRAAGRILIIASTTGEGDAPDSLSGFVGHHMTGPADLKGLSYGLLALGDRSYAAFCGFGRALDVWLQSSGAARLFDRVEVDDGDPGNLRHWQRQLGVLTGRGTGADWIPPAPDRWRLSARTHLNPGSSGGEAHLLAFEPVGHVPDWSAGDIAGIGLPDPADGSRDYSVASLPADGRAEFIVRRTIRADGTPGLASGWLTHNLAVGSEVGLRIRRNTAFHAPDIATPLILIGNGTGLAGLRAHWRARQGRIHGGTWLMFGERSSRHDAFLDAELQAALAQGTLTRMDRAFSRDAGDGRYVQALIDEQADTLRKWIDRGAMILVCGSLEGMSGGVDRAITLALGADRTARLRDVGRYRRDVY